MKKNRDMICPECNGTGFLTVQKIHDPIQPFQEQCFYCIGTGIATDDDDFEHIYKYDNGDF